MKETIAENFRRMFIFIEWAAWHKWAQLWELQQRCHRSSYLYPSLITLAGSFRMKITHLPFFCNVNWPFCLQGACTCSPSCTFNRLTVQVSVPALKKASWTVMGTAAEKYSKFTSHQGRSSAEPVHNFWFQTGKSLLKVSQTACLLPRPSLISLCQWQY